MIAPRDPDLVTVPVIARRLGKHEDTLYRLCRTGAFPTAVKVGSRWLISVPKLERWLHGDDPIGNAQRRESEGP